MRLAQLDINYVRNLVGAHLECCPGINCLYGENAAGKTAVLEAIHLLARARSFRTPRIGDVIQHGRTSLTVVAQLVDDNGRHIVTGLDKSVSSTQIRFNGARITRRSEQAHNPPPSNNHTGQPEDIIGYPKRKKTLAGLGHVPHGTGLYR